MSTDVRPAAPAIARRAAGLRIARLRDLALVPAILGMMVVGWIVSPAFLHWTNLQNVLQQQSEISLLVLAEALVLLCGRMDLSLESTFGLAPGIAAWLTLAPGVAHGLGWLSGGWAVPLTLAVGLAIGLTNGLLIVRFGLNGFIVTLGMLIVLRGLLTGISGGKTFFNLPASMIYLGNAVWLGDAARAAGIRVNRVLWTALTVASVLAAMGGLLLTGRLASVAAAQGNGAIFTVFAAAVIGGVSLSGGRGTIFGAFTGILLLYLIQNVLTLAGVPAQWIGALNGAIILVALIISRITSGQAQN
jgi:simple sugar transport system permease protein